MTEESYRVAFDKAVEELYRVLQEQDALQRRLDRLLETVASLGELLSEELEPEIRNLLLVRRLAEAGLTDAIRTMLRTTSANYLTAAEMRDYLMLMDYDLSGYSNPVGAVHTVMKRLVELNEVTEVPLGGNKLGYQWNWKAEQAKGPVKDTLLRILPHKTETKRQEKEAKRREFQHRIVSASVARREPKQ